MAVKQSKLDYFLLVLCALVSIGLGVAFMGLRQNCMIRKTNDFVEGYVPSQSCVEKLFDFIT